MKIENVRVFGFEPALRAMRNPKESWAKSDSRFYQPHVSYYVNIDWPKTMAPEFPVIGPEDMGLARNLIRGGSEHRKFLRQIMVWVDITIPRYCWQELDTYKVSTVRNSCSTMHKLGSRLLTQEDFEISITPEWLDHINELIILFQQEKDVPSRPRTVRNLRRELKNMLPEGFLQKATYTLSYETVLTILRQRHNHRLDEWHWQVKGSICHFLLTLPYVKEFAEALLPGLLREPGTPAGTVGTASSSGSPA